MKKWISLLLTTTLMLGVFSGCAAAPEQTPAPAAKPVDTRPLLDGATLVTFGDSLTALSTWPQQTASALNMNLVNAGIGAHHTDHGIARLERDVLSKNPDFVIICFGTNDFYRPVAKPQVDLETYKNNLVTFIEKIREKNAIPILMTPPFISESASGGPRKYPEKSVNGALDTYVEAMRTVAAEQKTDLIDIHAVCDESQEESVFLLGDGVHLTTYANDVYTDTITAYMKEHFRTDSSAPRVKTPTAPKAEDGVWTKNLISFDPSDWLVVFDDTINITAEDDGAISFANTTGQWPEAHYSPAIADTFAAPVVGSVLNVDVEFKAGSNILLFFDGASPTLAYKNSYVSLTPYLKSAKPTLKTSGDDISAGQTVKCTIPLSSIVPDDCVRDDGTVWLSGVKVFAIGAKGKKVTINELSISTAG